MFCFDYGIIVHFFINLTRKHVISLLEHIYYSNKYLIIIIYTLIVSFKCFVLITKDIYFIFELQYNSS